jgi:hypothetical protein
MVDMGTAMAEANSAIETASLNNIVNVSVTRFGRLGILIN